MDDFVHKIGELARKSHRLARLAEKQYAVEVERILSTQSRDTKRIEQLLDGMLDFGFDPRITQLYKKLCRYYFEIDSRATVSYVHAYRDLWDEEEKWRGVTRPVIMKSGNCANSNMPQSTFGATISRPGPPKKR